MKDQRKEKLKWCGFAGAAVHGVQAALVGTAEEVIAPPAVGRLAVDDVTGGRGCRRREAEIRGG